MKNREKTALKTIPWDFPAVHWLRLHTRGPRSGTPQAAITSPNAATAEPAQPDSLLGFLNTPSLLTHTDAEAGPRPPRRHLREQGHLPFPATTGPALSEQLSRLELIVHPVDKLVVEVITTKVCITVCSKYFDNAITDFDNRNVECTTT